MKAMKVQKLVRLRLGSSAQPGSVCERKMNVGGNEKGFLSREAGVATKGSSPDIEGVCFFVCFVLLLLLLLLLIVFPYVSIVNLALTQARSIHSVEQRPQWEEKRCTFQYFIAYDLPPLLLEQKRSETVSSWANWI